MSIPKIVEVMWLSRDAEEAVVTVTDGAHTFLCFAHPFRGEKDATVQSPIITLGAEGVVRVTEVKPRASRLGSDFAHEVVGVVTNASASLVQVGEILIELDVTLPGDVLTGDSIKFMVERLDFVS